MYKQIKNILFKLNPEYAHAIALTLIKFVNNLNLTRLFFKNTPSQSFPLLNLIFPNKIGLAAGLDKNGDYIDALASLGFGFIEIGTVTPKPQKGNPKPRLFRLVEHEAIINRMGFNNKGIDYVVNRLKKTKYKGILGINIGKNKDTPNEKAVDDYLLGFNAFWRYASYITVNISSPNTPGLRALQEKESLEQLLSALKNAQANIHALKNKYVPLVVKISPDLTDAALEELAHVLLAQKIDGVIATNTTIHRDITHAHANETGGLSGKPLQDRSTDIIKKLAGLLNNRIPIIAVGGIHDEASAREKLNAGAQLLQVYTSFIYQGPSLISKLALM